MRNLRESILQGLPPEKYLLYPPKSVEVPSYLPNTNQSCGFETLNPVMGHTYEHEGPSSRIKYFRELPAIIVGELLLLFTTDADTHGCLPTPALISLLRLPWADGKL